MIAKQIRIKGTGGIQFRHMREASWKLLIKNICTNVTIYFYLKMGLSLIFTGTAPLPLFERTKINLLNVEINEIIMN